jgi:hypothetical protein
MSVNKSVYMPINLLSSRGLKMDIELSTKRSKREVATYSQDRVCASCSTKLSIYNPGKLCHVHTWLQQEQEAIKFCSKMRLYRQK